MIRLRRPLASTSGNPRRGWTIAIGLLVREADRKLTALISLALLVVALSSALAALSPVLLKLIIDHLTTSNAWHGVGLALGLFVSAYASSHWLSRSLNELNGLIVGRADQQLQRRLSLRLFNHVMALPFTFHVKRRTGALSQTLTNGLNGYRLVLQHLILTVLPVLLQLILMSTILLLFSQGAFLSLIGMYLACYTITFCFGAARMARPAREVSTAHIDANALFTDTVLNYEAVKTFVAERSMYQRMDNAFAATERQWVRFFSRKTVNGVLVTTVFALAIGTTTYLAAKQVQQGRMSLGDFILVNSYVLQIFSPLERLGFAMIDIARGMAFIEKMTELFQQKPGSLIDGRALQPGPGELVFDDVFFSYTAGCTVLDNVCFQVREGTTVALVGASGSGKTSLIRLLVRFWEPDSGQILLDRTPISEVSMSSLRQAIAVVPQETLLFNDTIAYNIAIGRPESSMEEIIAAARLAHIHDFIASRPDGYQTVVGERGLKLSGGEKQRIAIARAVLMKPRIFVFDEATSSLDSKTEQHILQCIDEVSHGTTTLLIAHRLSTIVTADEILVLRHGRIIERGHHQDLLDYGGVYQDMWKAQHHDSPRHTVAV